MSSLILVVDDNEINLLLISKILELEGYRVCLARNGVEAIQAVIQTKPDLAILDILMPDMDGFTLCGKLREPPLNFLFPIVMLTAMNSEAVDEKAMKAGANEVWSKPFDMDLFRQSIGKLIHIPKDEGKG